MHGRPDYLEISGMEAMILDLIKPISECSVSFKELHTPLSCVVSSNLEVKKMSLVNGLLK
jgi:hypothetical protein